MHLLVVIQNDDHVCVHEASVVHGLISHSAGNGAVANDCNGVVVPLLCTASMQTRSSVYNTSPLQLSPNSVADVLAKNAVQLPAHKLMQFECNIEVTTVGKPHQTDHTRKQRKHASAHNEYATHKSRDEIE